jgi:RNA polymerase subunit RPABC4/transcription elongation factor Spt4
MNQIVNFTEKTSDSTFSGKMNCSHCHQALAASAKFCNRCGMPQTPASDVLPAASHPDLVCEACQAPCQPHTKFCPQCGHTLGLPAQIAPLQPRPPLLRWALVAAAVVLVGGVLAWAWLKPSAHTTAASGAQPTAPRTSPIDIEDQAKADALVGPPSSAQTPPPTAAAPSVVEPQADDAATVPTTSTEAAAPRSAEPSKPASSKPAVPPSRPAAKPQTSPTLQDLLD